MLACRIAVLPPDSAGPAPQRLHTVVGGALALLTLASFGILVSRTLELNGGVWTTLWRDLRLALTVTHFGHVWWWRVPALAVAWAAWARGPRHRGAGPGWIMLVAIAAIALTRSETGHPADHGDFTLPVWIDWLHILAAATWVGSLFGMTLAVFPRMARQGEHALVRTAAMFQRLSTLSGAALAVLLACGIFNAFQQLGRLDALWTTRYGVNLDVKLALVLVMIAIGAHNRYVKLPRLLGYAGLPAKPSLVSHWLRGYAPAAAYRDGAQVLRACARAVLAESLLGIAVIGATATLIHSMPPADMPPAHAGHAAAMRVHTSMDCPAGVTPPATCVAKPDRGG